MTQTQPRRRRQAAPVCLTLGLVFSVLAPTGCSKPLLSPSDTRSPFDRYDAVRNQYATQYVEDEFGRERPNIRARLTPRE